MLCVPNIHKNLISVNHLCNTNKVSVEFFSAHFQVKNLSSVFPLLQGRTKDELYESSVTQSNLTSFFASPSPKHTFYKGTTAQAIILLSFLKWLFPIFHFSVRNLSTRPMEYIFTNVWTSPVISFDNYKHYCVIIDHYTRYTWLYPLKTKFQVQETFIPFKAPVENCFNTRIGTIYSNNGGEFIALRQFLSSSEISHFTSPLHTSEHNGISERKHLHVVEIGLSLLTHVGMPNLY